MEAVPDPSALRAWLATHLEGIDEAAPIDLEVISGGTSNVTLGVRVGDREVVVRRPPVTAFLPTANDMGREHRFYAALRDTPVPTPQALAFCADDSVIGAPFYVMERLYGVVPQDPSVLDGLTAEEGRTLSERFVDVMVAIHAVDIDEVGLGDVGRPTGYLERQVRRWTDQWHRSKAADDPAIDELAAILAAAVPPSPPATIVHGDYRLGNLMVDRTDRTRIIGVFDWEMATIGDPLADVGYTLLYWGRTGRPEIHPSQGCADLAGFLSADELAARYAAASGTTVEHLAFYTVLAAFKLQIIGEGQRAGRRRAGVATEADATPHPSLADWALDLWRSGRPG